MGVILVLCGVVGAVIIASYIINKLLSLQGSNDALNKIVLAYRIQNDSQNEWLDLLAERAPDDLLERLKEKRYEYDDSFRPADDSGS